MESSFREIVRPSEPRAAAFSPHQGKQILVVDPDAEMRALVSDCLSEVRLEVVEARHEQEVLRTLSDFEPHVILTELWLSPGGFDYVRQLRECVPFCPVIVLAAYGTEQDKMRVLSYGVAVFLTKPVRLQKLRHAVLAVLDHGVLSNN